MRIMQFIVFFVSSLLAVISFAQIPDNQCAKHLPELVKKEVLDLSDCWFDDTSIYNVLLFLDKNPRITNINLTDNLVSDATAKWLKTNKNIRKVNFSYTNIGYFGMLALGTSKTLNSIIIDTPYNGDDIRLGRSSLISNARDSQSIQELDVRSSDETLSDEDAFRLASNKNLTAIAMNGVKSYDTFSPKVIQALADNHHLISLKIISAHLLDKDVALIVQGNPDLQVVDFSGNDLSSNAAQSLIQLKSIKIINISGNRLDDKGATILASIPTLIELDISGNHLTNTGAINLSKSNSIKILGLYHNDIDDQAAKALAADQVLESLWIEDTNITDTGVSALLQNPSLREFGFSSPFSELSTQAIAAIKSNRTLKTLALQSAKLSDEAIKALANNSSITELYLDGMIINKNLDPFITNHTLKILHANRTSLGDAGAIALAKNQSIIKLDLAINDIGSAGALAFAQNTTLRELAMVDMIGRDAYLKLKSSETLIKFDNLLDSYPLAKQTQKSLFCSKQLNPYYCNHLIEKHNASH